MISDSLSSVLVIGGAGFIGSHIVDALLENHHCKSVVVLDSFFLGNSRNLKKNLNSGELSKKVRILRGDATDLSTLLNIIGENNIRLVLNLGVIPLIGSLSQPYWSSNINYGIAVAACEAVRMNPHVKLVHFSSSEVYGNMLIDPMTEEHPKNPETPYAAAKLSGDHMVSSYVNTFGIQALIVRPFNNYGPRQNSYEYRGIFPSIAYAILHEVPIQISGNGQQTRDFVHVSDTALATLKIIECGRFHGEVYNVSSETETSIFELVKKSYVSLHIKEDKQHIIFGNPREADVTRHRGNSNLLFEATGFRPRRISDDLIASTLLSLIQEMK